MVNLRILFDTTTRTPSPGVPRDFLNKKVQYYNCRINNLDGGYDAALKMINARIHTVLTKMTNFFPKTGVMIHIAPEKRDSPYSSSSYRGAKSNDFQRISPSVWDHCVKTSIDQTVVACVELPFYPPLVHWHDGLFKSWWR